MLRQRVVSRDGLLAYSPGYQYEAGDKGRVDYGSPFTQVLPDFSAIPSRVDGPGASGANFCLSAWQIQRLTQHKACLHQYPSPATTCSTRSYL